MKRYAHKGLLACVMAFLLFVGIALGNPGETTQETEEDPIRRLLQSITRVRPPSGKKAGARTRSRRSRKKCRKCPADTGKTFYIKYVVDGDTLRRSDDERIRLIGVDTPETKHPFKQVEYFGHEASAFTRRSVEDKYVRLKYDRNYRDRYGRILAYVFRRDDNFFLNAEIVRQGYGFAYTRFSFKYIEEFRQLEKDARAAGRGLWASDNDPPPQVEYFQ
jgi:endonuclease YncB( thermonuclease family)